MMHWPPLEQQETDVRGWWKKEWRQRGEGADERGAAGKAASGRSYEESYDGRLLAAPGTIALQLFVDWYQKHSQGHHSVGLIWACVLNLPREERYELHNMMLVGLLPGPVGTSRQQLQGALQIARDELIDLFKNPLQIGGRSHRVFLHMMVGDVPAVRQAMGIRGVSGNHACPYCDAHFRQCSHGLPLEQHAAHRNRGDANGPAAAAAAAAPTAAAAANPAGKSSDLDYRLSHVDPRLQRAYVHADHVVHARIWVNCPQLPKAPLGPSGRPILTEVWRDSQEAYEAARAYAGRLAAPSSIWQELAKKWSHNRSNFNAQSIETRLDTKRGTRARCVVCWSALRDLPYFDSVRAAPIDVMHNILLGLCKQIMRVATGHKIDEEAAAAAAGEAAAAASAAAAAQQPQQELHDACAKDAAAAPLDRRQHAEAEEDEADSEAEVDSEPPWALMHAADAAGVPCARGSVAFGEHERQVLQSFMDASLPPRDVGRIRERLVSLDHMKAVEWLNWISMQAVPAVRTLVYQRAICIPPQQHQQARGVSRQARGGSSQVRRANSKQLHNVSGAHLRLFSLTQQLVERLCRYSTSEVDIEWIDAQLRGVVQACEDTFPNMGARMCTPNMHLALHLPAQLRDFGPVQGWWCFSFERVMGVASNLPSKPGTGSVDVARRLLAMLHLSNAGLANASTAAAGAPASFALSARQQISLPAPVGAGFKHAYTRGHAGASLRHSFTFAPNADGARAAAQMSAWRQGAPAEGHEPFPAILFNSGSGSQRSAGASRHAGGAPAPAPAAAVAVGLLQLVRSKSMFTRDFDTPVLVDASQRRGVRSWPHLRPDQRLPGRELVSLKQVQLGLLAFYFTRHSAEVVAHYTREIGAVQERLNEEAVRSRARAEAAALAALQLPHQRMSRAAEQQRSSFIQTYMEEAMEPLRLLQRQMEQEREDVQQLSADVKALATFAKHLYSAMLHFKMPLPHRKRKHGAADADAAGSAADGSAAAAAAAAAVPGAAAAGSVRWSTALAWYMQQLDPEWRGGRIDIFDKLLLCGEEISSDIARSRTGVNSFIFASFARSPRQRLRVHYGRVSYYARHRFRGRDYCFAVPRWYERATQLELQALWPAYQAVHQQVSVGASDPHKERREACLESMERWPVLCFAYSKWRECDLLPVHNITGRWMPSLARRPDELAGRATLQFACQLRSRLFE